MTHVAVLGAGIAGISAGWLLQQKGIDYTIIEKQSYIGGLARSFEWHGFYCDFAAHRLFTQNEEVLQQLLNLVPMGRHIRRSKIYLQRQWMGDPLDVMELLKRLRPDAGLGVIAAYLARPKNLEEVNFENYVVKRYGRELYRFFFKPYTEKLFGIRGDQISVLWARKKVRLASPLDKIRESHKTKFAYFYYPLRGGYGSIVNRLYDEVKDHVVTNAQVTQIHTDGPLVTGITYQKDGTSINVSTDAVVSTLPMSLTGRLMGFPLSLEFQKVDAVYLWLKKPRMTDLHWIYFMDADIAINRLVEFKNMSPIDTDPETTVICAEVTQDIPDPIEKVTQDLIDAGMIQRSEVLDTKVIREKFAYPVYNQNYEQALANAEAYFGQYQNLHLVGRSAEFRHREVDDNFERAIEVVSDIASRFPVPEAQRLAVKPMKTEKQKPQICAVILTYNHYDDTRECLESLMKSDYDAMNTVVVDNGSSDGTPARIRNEFPQVHVVENSQNLGVPSGYNVGFRYALEQGADYILMLNNDTVVAPDMASLLLHTAETDERCGVVMPKVMYYGSQDDVWSAGGRYRSFPPSILLLDKSNLNNEQVRTIEYAPSCGLLIHRRAFEKAGLFDPGYFFMFDDWDFSERVRTHGLNIYLTPTALMWHKVSKTTKDTRMSFYWQTFGSSLTRFYRRHGKPVWISLPLHVGYIIFRDMVWKRNWKYLPDLWRGIISGMNKPLGNIPTYLQ